jgi:predicted  nucleic acid-binding Zn-ribbon protein
MSSDPDVEETRSVTEGPVTVTKSFAAEEFPVPAMKFVVESTANESVSISLVDEIPESFPMENVGFHPDYEKDNWTAYKSHRVEYERTLDPGETTTTVYGIRLDDEDPSLFLTEPTLSVREAGVEAGVDQPVDDVLGEDSNQLVRDVLSGDRESLPGMGDGGSGGVDAPDLTVDAAGGASAAGATAAAGDSGADEDLELQLDDEESADAGGDRPTPEAFDDTGENATSVAADSIRSATDDAGSAGEEDLKLDLDPEPRSESESEGDADAAAGSGDADATASEEVAVAEAEAGTDSAGGGRRVTAGSLAAALAAEVRRDEADPEDVAALRDALGGAGAAPGGEGDDAEATVPRSFELRVQRLQNQVEDLSAYSEGLKAFLDEEGTAEELIEGFRTDLRETRDDLDALSAAMDDADADRGRLDDEVGDLRERLSGVDDRLDEVDDRLGDAVGRLDDVDDRLDAVDDRVAAADDRLDDVDDRVGTLDDRLDDLADRIDEVGDRATRADEATAGLDEELGDLRDELSTLDADVDATRQDVDADLADLRDDVSGLESDLSEVDETVAEFRAFRERLSSALGPMVGGDVGGESDADDGEASGEADAAEESDGDEGEGADDGADDEGEGADDGADDEGEGADDGADDEE